MEKKTFDPAEFLGVQVLSPLEKRMIKGGYQQQQQQQQQQGGDSPQPPQTPQTPTTVFV